jgi:hypothetical protein
VGVLGFGVNGVNGFAVHAKQETSGVLFRWCIIPDE